MLISTGATGAGVILQNQRDICDRKKGHIQGLDAAVVVDSSAVAGLSGIFLLACCAGNLPVCLYP